MKAQSQQRSYQRKHEMFAKRRRCDAIFDSPEKTLEAAV